MYHAYMGVLNLRGIPDELIRRLKMEAAECGVTLRQRCIDVLGNTVYIGGNHDGDGGVDGQTSKGGKGGRGVSKSTVPIMRKAEKSEVGLHTVHSVRDELAGGGRPVQERQTLEGILSVKCEKPGHKPVETANGWWCMTCYKEARK